MSKSCARSNDHWLRSKMGDPIKGKGIAVERMREYLAADRI